MTEAEQAQRFADEVSRIVDHFVQEHDIMVSTMIGVFQLKIMEIAINAAEIEPEEDD